MNDYHNYHLYPKTSDKPYAEERRLPVDIYQVNSEEDRLLWERIFLRSYLTYRPLSDEEKSSLAQITGAEIKPEGGLKYKRQLVAALLPLVRTDFEKMNWNESLVSRLREIKNVLDVSWQKIVDPSDPTICIVAKPQKGSGEEEQAVIGTSYATSVYDPVRGHRVGLIEGTYVPSQYRKRGVGSQLLSGISAFRQEMDVDGLLFWTHYKNPNTQNIYPNFHAESKPQNKDYKSTEVAESMWVAPITERTKQQYLGVIDESARKQLVVGADADSVTNLIANTDYHVKKIQGTDMSFEAQYRSLLKSENAEFDATKFEHIKGLLRKEKLSAYLIEHKNSANHWLHPCGIAFVEEGIKFPRDAFLSADITAVHLVKDHSNLAASHALLSKIKEDIMKHNKTAQTPTEAIRWVLRTGHPLETIMQVPTELQDSPDFVKPIRFPFKLYRIPLTEQAIGISKLLDIPHKTATSSISMKP